MSTTEIPVDVDVLRAEIRKTYTEVSTEQGAQFIFPTGRAWARELCYPEPELPRVPDAIVDSFAGVANHWTLGRIQPGEVMLDLGCGGGTDLLLAAQMAGPQGRAIGVDMTAAMLERARASARETASTRACWSSGPAPTSSTGSSSILTPAPRSRTRDARRPNSARGDPPSEPPSQSDADPCPARSAASASPLARSWLASS